MRGSCNTTDNASISYDCVTQFFDITTLSSSPTIGSDVTTAESMAAEHVVVWVPYVGLLFIICICVVLAISFYQRQKRVQKRRQNAMDYLELNIDLKRKRLHAIMHAKTSIEDVVREAFYHGTFPNASNSIRIQPLPLNQPITSFKLSCSRKSFEENAGRIHGSIQSSNNADANQHGHEMNISEIESQPCSYHCCTHYDCNANGCQHISFSEDNRKEVSHQTFNCVASQKTNNRGLIKAQQQSHQFYNENEQLGKRKKSKRSTKTLTNTRKANSQKNHDYNRTKKSDNSIPRKTSREGDISTYEKEKRDDHKVNTIEYSQLAWASLKSKEIERKTEGPGKVKLDFEDRPNQSYKQINQVNSKSYHQTDAKSLPYKTWARTNTLSSDDCSPNCVTLVNDDTSSVGSNFPVGLNDFKHSERDGEIEHNNDENNGCYENRSVKISEEDVRTTRKELVEDKQCNKRGRRIFGDGIESNGFHDIVDIDRNNRNVRGSKTHVKRLEPHPHENHATQHDQFETGLLNSTKGIMNHGYKPDSFENFPHSQLYGNYFHSLESQSTRPEMLSGNDDVSLSDDLNRLDVKSRDAIDNITNNMHVYSIGQDLIRDNRQSFHHPLTTVAYSNQDQEFLPGTSNGVTYTTDQPTSQTDVESSPSTNSNTSLRRAKKRRKTLFKNGRRTRKLSDSSLNLSPKKTKVFQVAGNIPVTQYNDTEEYV